MKNYFLILFVLVLQKSNLTAQVSDWLWAKGAGTVNTESSNGVCTDANGCSYITGSFQNANISFDSIVLTNQGGNDYFIAKYDGSGNVIWAQSAGGIYDEAGADIVSDASNNVYVTGYFSSPSITFGSFTLNSLNPGSLDIFIVKYNPSGNVVWAQCAGGTTPDG